MSTVPSGPSPGFGPQKRGHSTFPREETRAASGVCLRTRLIVPPFGHSGRPGPAAPHDDRAVRFEKVECPLFGLGIKSVPLCGRPDAVAGLCGRGSELRAVPQVADDDDLVHSAHFILQRSRVRECARREHQRARPSTVQRPYRC